MEDGTMWDDEAGFERIKLISEEDSTHRALKVALTE